MITKLLDSLSAGMARLRADERGAESSEVILVLVLLVVGLMAAWYGLKDKLFDKVQDTTACIDTAGNRGQSSC